MGGTQSCCSSLNSSACCSLNCTSVNGTPSSVSPLLPQGTKHGFLWDPETMETLIGTEPVRKAMAWLHELDSLSLKSGCVVSVGPAKATGWSMQHG